MGLNFARVCALVVACHAYSPASGTHARRRFLETTTGALAVGIAGLPLVALADDAPAAAPDAPAAPVEPQYAFELSSKLTKDVATANETPAMIRRKAIGYCKEGKYNGKLGGQGDCNRAAFSEPNKVFAVVDEVTAAEAKCKGKLLCF